MATGKKLPSQPKPTRPVRNLDLMPPLPPYEMAWRNLQMSRPHPLAEGAD